MLTGSSRGVECLWQRPFAAHSKAAPREGLLWLFAFLPAAIGDSFAQLIDDVLPLVIKVSPPPPPKHTHTICMLQRRSPLAQLPTPSHPSLLPLLQLPTPSHPSFLPLLLSTGG